MQNEHSKSVRNHLCDALLRRNKCYEKLQDFCDNNDHFADMERILEDNKSAHKAKHKRQVGLLIWASQSHYFSRDKSYMP
jgi:hypothetical protein